MFKLNLSNIDSKITSDNVKIIHLDHTVRRTLLLYVQDIMKKVGTKPPSNSTYYSLNYDVPSERVKKYMDNFNNKKVVNINKADIILVNTKSLYKLLNITKGYYIYGALVDGKANAREIKLNTNNIASTARYGSYWVEETDLNEALQKIYDLDVSKLYDLRQEIENSYPNLTLHEYYKRYSKMFHNPDPLFKKLALLNMYNNYNIKSICEVIDYDMGMNHFSLPNFKIWEHYNAFNSSVHTKYLGTYLSTQYSIRINCRYNCNNLFKDTILHRHIIKPYQAKLMHVNLRYYGFYNAISDSNDREAKSIYNNLFKFKMSDTEKLVGLVVDYQDIQHLKNDIIDIENKTPEEQKEILNKGLMILDNILNDFNFIGNAEDIEKILGKK